MIPGQGSDHNIFSKLELNPQYCLHYLNWVMPNKNDDMIDLAKKMAAQIDTTHRFSIIGVSLGGMVATELTMLLKPIKTIIISSASGRHELPWRYKFQRYFPIYTVVPPFIYKIGAQILQPIIEPDRKKRKEDIQRNACCKRSKFL